MGTTHECTEACGHLSALDRAVLRHRSEQTDESHRALLEAMLRLTERFYNEQTIDYMERTTRR